MKVLAIFCVFIVLLNEMDAVPQSDDNNYFKERAEEKKTEESDKKGSDAKKGDENDDADERITEDEMDEKKPVKNMENRLSSDWIGPNCPPFCG